MLNFDAIQIGYDASVRRTFTEKNLQMSAEAPPLKRNTIYSDVLNASLFLVSRPSDFITSENLPVCDDVMRHE